MGRRIIFMGTPDFAVESLKQLIEAEMEVVAVVTSPDRPAGRGQQVRQSAVKTFALEKELPVLQPEKLKNPDFINTLAAYKADLFVVVAFRMLPEVVWGMPEKGTINLHGSLLPQYRGAAPINWAVMHGDTETGATTFFIEKEIDTGKIIDSVTIPIHETDNAGTVHDRLMISGAQLLVDTVRNIFDGKAVAKDQAEYDLSDLKHAPKIFKADCKIDWSKTTRTNYNMIRGLSPYPTAWTVLKAANGKSKSVKIFEAEALISGENNSGEIKIMPDGVQFGTSDGWLSIKTLQLEGKKRMPIDQFVQGFSFEDYELELN